MATTGFSRPALQDSITRIEADLNSRLPGADSRVRRSVLSVLARAIAGVVHGLYGYLDFIIQQVFADTAQDDFLIRMASVFGFNPISATYTTGPVPLTGVDGVTIPAGTILQRGDGVEFATNADYTISGGTVTTSVTASLPGSGGNTISGTTLSFVSPLSGVNASVVSGTLTGGEDTETTDSLKARFLARLRKPPQGGNEDDYTEWASEVLGLTRSWVYPKEAGSGSVTLRFMMDGTYSNGIPLSGDVSTANTFLQTKRPVTAELFVFAPNPIALNFSILLKKADGSTETSATIRAAVQASLQDLITREATPKADGVINILPTGTLQFSRIRQAISNAAGEFDHNISVPSGDVTPSGTGDIYVMGTITWL